MELVHDEPDHRVRNEATALPHDERIPDVGLALDLGQAGRQFALVDSHETLHTLTSTGNLVVGHNASYSYEVLRDGETVLEADMQDAARMGVDGTPAVFINGMPVGGGAVGFDALVEVIEKEQVVQRSAELGAELRSGLEALAKDPGTEAIVLISKPPSQSDQCSSRCPLILIR